MSSPSPPSPFPPFPEIALPGFLRPLLLVPIAQHRVAETVKSWLDGRHTQIFGPLEQVVAAVVILGLAMRTPPDFWDRPVEPDHTASGWTSDDNAQNATAASSPYPAMSESRHPSFLSGMIDYLTNRVDEYSLSPMTLGLIAIGLCLGLTLVPADLKTRLKTSWDLFWPPWKDRSLSEPAPEKSTESERARERKVRPETADRLDEEDARHQERARRKEAEREKAKAEAAGEGNGSPETEVDGDDEVGREKGSTLDEKEELKMRQKERLKAAEEARDRGEGLTEEEKARLAAKREKITAKQKDPEARSTGRGLDLKSKTEKDTGVRIGDSGAEDQAESKTRTEDAAEEHDKPTDPSNKDHQASKRDLSEGSTACGKGVSPTTSDHLEPEGLSRSERARWVKRRDAGGAMPPTSHSRSVKSDVRVQSGNPSAGSGAALSTRPANAPHTTEPDLTASERAQVAKTSSSKSSSDSKEVQRRLKSTEDRSSAGETSATSDEDDPLMAGDYRPLKSVLKKSKKKPRQRKNIHHNYFLTMRGHQPHLIPFPHGFHPKPHHPRHTLWYDNVPKNADHIMAPPPVPKKPEGDENDSQVVEGTIEKKNNETTADDKANDSTSTMNKKTVKNKEVRSMNKDRKTTVDPIKDDQRLAQSETSRAKDLEGTQKEASGKSTSSGEKITDGDKARSAATSKSEAPVQERQDGKDRRTEREEKKSKEKEREMAKVKAEAEAKERARSRAKKDEEANSVPSQMKPSIPAVDPRLKTNFVAQGLLCCLLYMINQQLALLLLLFFAYKFLQSESPVTERSTSHHPEARRPPSPGRAVPSRTGGIPDEMGEKLKRAEAANARKEGKEGVKERTSRADEVKEEREPKASGDANPKERGQSDRARAGAEQRPYKSQTGKIGEQEIREEAKTPRSLADLTPEQKERYLKALAARKAKSVEKGKSAEGSPFSAEQKQQDRSDPRLTESTGRDAKTKFADMTDGEREAYLAARIRREERERLVERAKNTSGLNIDDKEALAKPSRSS